MSDLQRCIFSHWCILVLLQPFLLSNKTLLLLLSSSTSDFLIHFIRGQEIYEARYSQAKSKYLYRYVKQDYLIVIS